MRHVRYQELSGSDAAAQCDDYDTAIAVDWLRIRAARMIDVSGHVPSRRAVDTPSAVQLENIARAPCQASVGFFGRYSPAAISCNAGGALDRLCCEQAESGCGAADTERT